MSNTVVNLSDINIDKVGKKKYVASSLERKRAMLMYFLFGIFMVLNRDDLSEFENYHLKQSIGWRIMAIVGSFISLLFILFPPIIWIVWVLLMCIFIFFIFQVLVGISKTPDKASTSLFYGLGSWFIMIFSK